MAKNNELPSDDVGRKLSIEDQLKGKTLQVYLYMVKKKEAVGVREVQRDLGFSSPSVANYHIEKLVELALVSQDEYGRYFVVQKVQIGVLQGLRQYRRADSASLVILCSVFHNHADRIFSVEL